MPRAKPTVSPKTHDWADFIIRHTPAAVISMDAQGRITDFNPAAEVLSGYSQKEALGRRAEEVLHCEGADPKSSPTRLAMMGQEVTAQEINLVNRSGHRVPVMLAAFALKDDQGVALGGVMIIRDLTPVKALEKERRHLVNMFAHDLKTPVVGMAGLIRRLHQGKVGPLSQKQLAYLETIDKEMQQLEKLITRFLEFARLDWRILAPSPSPVQVEKECREVITLLLPLAEGKSIELKAAFPAETLEVMVDPLLFQRVLENLLENAIKYSPPRTTVFLEVQREGSEARFAVRDQGPGIPAPDLAHLFEIFYRGQGAGQERGFGLGLATVKRVIDAHGGRLWLDTAPGQGTTFYFTLPLNPRGTSAGSQGRPPA